MNQLGRRHSVKRGHTLMWEGDESLVVANVVEGVLKLSTATTDGREQIVGVVYPSDFIGRPFGLRSHHTVTALTDSVVCLFSRPSFDGFARQHPDLEHRLLEQTLTELDRARHWMMLLGRKTATERVASFLIEMSSRLVEPGCAKPAAAMDRFDLPLDRQQIADVLGLTIETVSRQFTRLRVAGAIDLPERRAVVIRDRAALEGFAEAA